MCLLQFLSFLLGFQYNVCYISFSLFLSVLLFLLLFFSLYIFYWPTFRDHYSSLLLDPFLLEKSWIFVSLVPGVCCWSQCFQWFLSFLGFCLAWMKILVNAPGELTFFPPFSSKHWPLNSQKFLLLSMNSLPWECFLMYPAL